VLSRPLSHPARLVWFTLLVTVAFFLSGCIYLRLLQVKNQLRDFDQYFKVDTGKGVQIELLKPVLLGDDVRWLGLEPQKITPTGKGLEEWDIRWIKDLPPGIKETGVYDVEFSAFFKDDLLTRVFIEDRFFAYFPKEIFVRLLRSAGSAKISRSAREAKVNAASEDDELSRQLPSLQSLEQMLGAPSAREVQGNETVCRYRYSPVTPTGKGKAIGVTFVFASDTGRLQKLTGKLPTGSLYFDFRSDAETAKK
jgi:hypothetical protein